MKFVPWLGKLRQQCSVGAVGTEKKKDKIRILTSRNFSRGFDSKQRSNKKAKHKGSVLY